MRLVVFNNNFIDYLNVKKINNKNMSAYAILDLEVFDTEKHLEYKNLAPGIIEKYEGKILIRGGESVVQEGEWNPQRIVVIEFPSYEKAIEWSNSEEYQKAIELRKKGAKTNAIIVNGV
ncbi:DUF1330 domain-containing protein [Fulvivirga ligni]|uniref:DUF1330 domain-containing protein n=1 Tax=Fulvivirga ligni TaxID=2904246 RepID=UPI001F175A5D|nr:DUF1330 domain-containing protein [Fulvivirga ligni]UII19574.1 DUF1330 domain-containing protein [Fulvivirga ligni]